MNTVLLARLQALAADRPAVLTVLSDGKESLDLQELISRSVLVSDWLTDNQVRVLALQAENSIDWVVVDLACQLAGVVCLPVPGFFSRQQALFCMREAVADILLSDQDVLANELVTGGASVSRRLLPGSLALDAWDLGWPGQGLLPAMPSGTQKITFTSGSTGSPKGVCLSSEHQWQVAASLAGAIKVRGARHLCLLPLATLLENIAGVYVPLLLGGTVILPGEEARGLSGSSGLDVAAMTACIDRERPDSMILLPQLLLALVAACQGGWVAPATLKFVAVGGGKVAPGLIRTAREWGIPVYEGYGLSECGSVVALNTPEGDFPGSVGRVLPHCKVHVKDDEILVTGSCHLGYLGDTQSWYPEQIATGDLGRHFPDGSLTIFGRRKNQLISSFGRNINPEWVESALAAIPLLSRCVVLGEGQPYLGALLSAPPAVTDSQVQQWIDQVNAELPDYARVVVWQRLELAAWQGLLTPNGRVRRELLNENLAEAVTTLFQPAPAPLSVSC